MNILVKDKSFYKTLLTLCLPIALQQLITSGVNMMDTIMLGQVSETALSAASMATQVHLVFQFISMGVGTGAAVLYARYWGSNDRDSLKKSITVSFRLILLVGAIYTLIAAFFPTAVMGLLTNDPVVAAEGVKYLNWSIPCYLLMGLTVVSTCILRNIHKANLPFYTSIIAFVVNIFFNWVFIFGKLGAPAMGVAGAALGTTIARVVETGVILVYLLGIDKEMGYRVRNLLEPCGDLVREFLRVTIPTIISDVFMGVGNSMTAAVGGRISQSFMAGYSITSVVVNIILIFSSSLAQSTQIVVGNTLGEGNIKDVRKQCNTLLLLSAAVSIVISVLLLALIPVILKGYHLSSETKEVARELLQAQALIAIFLLLSSVITKGILRAGGDVRFLMIGDVVFLWCCSVPLGYLSGVVWGWSPFLVFIFLRIDYVLKLILCLFRYKGNKWIKKIRHAGE